MTSLIIGEEFNYILLFIVGFFPLLYKLFFWLYVIQLKEYRWDRFKEYLKTKQGKNALFNIFFVVEIILFILAIVIWIAYFKLNFNYYRAIWGVAYSIFFYYLILLNIFVIGKIFRKRILKPKITFRIIVLFTLFSIGGIIDFYLFHIFNLWNFTYLFILGVFLTLPFILFFYNFISLPIVNYKKNKIIKNAIEKSKNIKEPLKVSITGSYGKSSVKEFLSSILEQETLDKTNKNLLLKTPENINTEIGVSYIILNRLNNFYKYFVAEIGAYRRGEIRTLGKIVNHKYGFLTAIGNQHIGLFGNQENIIKGKFEIYEKVLENNGKLYVNFNNEYIRKHIKNLEQNNIVKYGLEKEGISLDFDAKSKILEIKNNPKKEDSFITKFEFSYKKINKVFRTNLIGEHNILNLTGVIAFCYDIGLKTEELSKYLLNLKKPKNTGEIFRINNGEKELILIDDTYNLSEASLKSGVSLFKYFEKKEKNYDEILVLDDILELGDEAKQIHFELGKYLAEKKLINKVFFIGVNYKTFFFNGLKKGGFKKENILKNLGNFKENTIILFEGRGAKNYLDNLRKN